MVFPGLKRVCKTGTHSKLKFIICLSVLLRLGWKKKTPHNKTNHNPIQRIRHMDLSQEGPTGSPVHSWNFVFWNASVLSTRSTSFYYPSTSLWLLSLGISNYPSLCFWKERISVPLLGMCISTIQGRKRLQIALIINSQLDILMN